MNKVRLSKKVFYYDLLWISNTAFWRWLHFSHTNKQTIYLIIDITVLPKSIPSLSFLVVTCFLLLDNGKSANHPSAVLLTYVTF